MINTKTTEILRYLGYKNNFADKKILGQINYIKKEFETCLTPKNIYGTWNCKVDSDGTIKINNITIKSKDLADHIKDCENVLLFVATLGTEADTLIRRYSISDMGKAVIAQAVCTAMIESYCDEIQCKIAKNEIKKGLYLKSRFSPGYGDFSITHQKDILNLLECNKRLGIALTDSFMIIPEKSVTAVIGLTKKQNHHNKKCESCLDLQCEFRKEQKI